MTVARVLDGDCLVVMPTLDAESVDAIVTDPPYHLTTGKKGGTGPASVNLNSPAGRARITAGFMGKAWDGGDVAFRAETWAAALRVAKPGAHLVAFGGTRTFHRLTCAIEDAGWEIRDCLSWLYGSGFPKSHNGPWGGTALKPGWEPIVLARKPLTGTVEGNHAKHGTGALNIDGCRIGTGEDKTTGGCAGVSALHGGGIKARAGVDFSVGRWPANVVLDDVAAEMLDEQSGERPGMKLAELNRGSTTGKGLGYGSTSAQQAGMVGYSDGGGASRFFYTAKASRSERNAGAENTHPTVKPLDLMQWLCRLVTPKGGLILDPFTGSGSTGRAAIAEGFSFIGIEMEPEYAAIARARIAEYAPLFNGAA